MVGLLQKRRLSRVNARHLLDDLASSYTFSVEEAVLVELIANALDAKSSEIHITASKKGRSLTIEDTGSGMSEEDFEKYHDLAESRKERGHGIGFAGLGGKLAHKVARKVITETQSVTYHGASEWYFKGDDLEWTPRGSKAFQHVGTRVTLHLEQTAQSMLGPDFAESVIRDHYGTLLDPFLSEIYQWESIYPHGVAFHINGQPLPKHPVVPNEAVELKREVDVQSKGRKRRRIGRALFILLKEPIPEERQGIAITTYGKTIKRDALGAHPRHPDRVTGWFESPELVECLTTDKQDFIQQGSLGVKFKNVRRQLQDEFQKWLREIDEVGDSQERRRAPRQLEQEIARLIRRIPGLRQLFAARLQEDVASPDPQGSASATLAESMQLTQGAEPGINGGNGLAVFPGNEPGQAPQLDLEGQVQVRRRRRTIRAGPRIERVDDPDRTEISWVEGNSVMINTAHPAYAKARHEGGLDYHERLAVLLALCQEAAVEPEARFNLLHHALTEWGKT